MNQELQDQITELVSMLNNSAQEQIPVIFQQFILAKRIELAILFAFFVVGIAFIVFYTRWFKNFNDGSLFDRVDDMPHPGFVVPVFAVSLIDFILFIRIAKTLPVLYSPQWYILSEFLGH